MRTGTLTSPKLIVPVQIARGTGRCSTHLLGPLHAGEGHERLVRLVSMGTKPAKPIDLGDDVLAHMGVVHVTELRGRLAQLGEEVDRLVLSPESRAAAKAALAEAESEAAEPTPRSNRIAQSLERVTRVLEEAGVLADAETILVRSHGRAVSLVGLLA
jgi:uncharacterized small protein (DUF1192 family)